MILRTLIILCVVCISSLQSAYAFHLWSGCDYERNFKIMVMQTNPSKPTPPLKLMTHVNDGLGTGFVYLSTASSSAEVVVLAHCWTYPFFQYEMPDHVNHDGNNKSGTVRFTVGSDAQHQVDVMVNVNLPFFGNYHTSAVALPTGNTSMPYMLMTPVKSVSGEKGTIPLIFQAT